MKLFYRFSFYFIIIQVFLCSCNQKTKEKKQFYYFDLEGFFQKEASRLQVQNPVILKTVSNNNTAEVKKIHVSKWSNELELFRNSDINKPSWKNRYNITNKPSLMTYAAKDLSLKTREINIYFSKSGRIDRVSINNRVENILYTSREQLEYYPDSIYSIIKTQEVELLGKNTYIITGKFIPF